MTRNNKVKCRLLVLLLVAAMLIMVSCQSGDEEQNGNTANPTAGQTASGESAQPTGSGDASDPTQPAEGTVTEAPTAIPTAVPRAPLTEEQKGKPFAEGMQGVEVLFESDYEDGDYTAGGMVLIANDDGSRIGSANGKLMLSYSEDHFINEWVAYAPYLDVDSYDTYEQMELSFEYKWEKAQNSGQPWYGMMVGCFVTNAPHICDNAEDGLWFGLSELSTMPIYGITSYNAGGWADGAARVSIPGNFEEARRVKIVCTNTRDCYVYVADADGVYSCWVEFHVSDTAVQVIDSTGKQVAELKNDGSNMMGGRFVFFNHMAGAQIDDLRVLAY